jgi:hypothetical protein
VVTSSNASCGVRRTRQAQWSRARWLLQLQTRGGLYKRGVHPMSPPACMHAYTSAVLPLLT